LETVTDARGAVTTYSYDALNRVTHQAYTDQTINFTYDAGTNGKSRLTGASDANHTLYWAYDTHGRVTGKGQTVGSVTRSVGYGYTNDDMTSLVTPSGQTVTYGYTNHRITSIVVGTTTVLSGVTYFPFGPVSGWTWGNSTSASRTYDTDGKISVITTAADPIDFGYDNAFRITGITDTTTSANSWTLGYDVLDRINSAAKTGTTYGWTYDANGNRLTQTGTSASTFTPSTTSNRLNSTTGALARTYSYDTAGNTETYSNLTYSFNDRGRMSSVTVGGTTSNYVYSALGQMIKKTVGSTTTLLMYDEAGHLLGEYSSTGALIQETVWMGDVLVATLRPNGSTGCASTICVFYVHTDQLNAPRKITQPSNNSLVWRWDSDPFGTVAPNQNPAGLGTFVYNLREPGMYYQAETGLNYNYFRDYDPQTGRYVESDPIGLAGGSFSTYAYVRGNPISRIDPLGLCGTDSNQHNYHIQRATLCSAAAAFSMLLAPGMSAPGAPAAQEGFTPQIVLTGNNPISQSVNSSTMTIVNTTLPTHSFYPGTVVIQVTPSGSNGSIINITGTGTSSDPLINDAVGLLFFGSVADLIAQMCSGSAGIPMP